MGDIATRAERARTAVVGGLREEQCISLPVPVRWEGSWADAFFTFFISTVGMVPYPAGDCRIVGHDGRVVVDESAFDVQQQPYDVTRDVPIENWEENYGLAYETYDAAFEELASGAPGDACERYARAVEACTPASQMVYYRAMNPTLFSR